MSLSEVESRISLVLVEIRELKKQFETVIRDKSIPLEERWALFVWAPITFKNTSSWVEDFDSEKLLGSKIFWYDDLYYERYETVNTTDMIERFKEKEEFTPEIIDAFKEEILQKNLGSWVNDW